MWQRRPGPAKPDRLDPGGLAPVLRHRGTNGLILHLLKLKQYWFALTPQFQDWDKNIYFNCSSEAVGSREACGVPFRFLFWPFKFSSIYHSRLESWHFLFSCCKPKDNELIKNKQCGYDVRKQDYVSTNHSPLLFILKRILSDNNSLTTLMLTRKFILFL